MGAGAATGAFGPPPARRRATMTDGTAPKASAAEIDEIDDEILDRSLTEVLRRLRPTPVVHLPRIGCWFVTGHQEARTVLRDPDRFTVDDPRFSTGKVLGSSMLTLDGAEHRRHRRPFAPLFDRRSVEDRAVPAVRERARRLVTDLAPRGAGDLRFELAAPLAVGTVVDVLGLDADPATVLAWYRDLVAGVEEASAGHPRSSTTDAARDALRDHLGRVAARAGSPLALVAATADLTDDEVFANTAVAMFGAIETGEGMTATCLWHLLSTPDLPLGADRPEGLVEDAVEESLRLEPAASFVDRYTTSDVILAGAAIPARALVRVSLTGANRDPAVFADPEAFVLDRPARARHLAFAEGPHHCIGARLARAETSAAATAALDLLPTPTLTDPGGSRPAGVIFRKPPTLAARWDVGGKGVPVQGPH